MTFSLASLDPATRQAFRDELLAIADTKLVLGNWYARQQRWGNAQQAYFEALRRAPHNADYAFNLAVSLDRMGQAQAARTYYENALELAASGGATFDATAVRERVVQLAPLATP